MNGRVKVSLFEQLRGVNYYQSLGDLFLMLVASVRKSFVFIYRQLNGHTEKKKNFVAFPRNRSGIPQMKTFQSFFFLSRREKRIPFRFAFQGSLHTGGVALFTNAMATTLFRIVC